MAKQSTIDTQELGSIGYTTFGGYLSEAYNARLYWPEAYDIYSRIWRSDPEIGGIVRPTLSAFTRQQSLDLRLPDDASSDDKAVRDYAYQMLEEAVGAPDLLETMIRAAAYGWAWFEIVWGRRDGKEYAGWRSKYDDGLPAIRKFGFRDHSSFSRWQFDDDTGDLLGMIQDAPGKASVTLPLDRSLHLTFGDPQNPEGLSPLESVWRLERVKFALETIFGIGAEHAAGHLSVHVTKPLGDNDERMIATAAKSILSAQEGNYAVWPDGVEGRVTDVPFAAADSLLEAIKYYGLLKLQVYNMQFIAMATTASTGAFSAMTDARAAAIMTYNGMMSGFMQQLNQQLGPRIFDNPVVRQRFPGMTARPEFFVADIERDIPLTELADFAAKLFPLMPVGDEDWRAIRVRSGFLPETLPDIEDEDVVAPDDEEDEDAQPESDGDGEPELTPDETDSLPEEAQEMSAAEWAELRQMVFEQQRDDDAYLRLMTMLDSATTAAELALVREVLEQ